MAHPKIEGGSNVTNGCPGRPDLEGTHALGHLELGLAAQGLNCVVAVALGYRSDSDFNATLPKSRLPAERVFTHL